MPLQKSSLTIDLPNTHNVIVLKEPAFLSSSRVPNYSSQEVYELRGTLELFLPARRRIRSIQVKLQNVEEAVVHGRMSRRLVLDETLEVSVDEEGLDRGVHIYEFNLRIDSRTPNYDRHPRGGTMQYLEATVQFHELFSRALTRRIPLIFVSHPNGEGFIPLDHVHRDYVDELGPLEVSFKTQHLTIAGYIMVEMYLPSPAPALEIKGLSVTLEQHTSIHDNGHLVETLPVDTHTLLEKGGREDCLMRAPNHSAAIRCFYYVKLPTDDYCRPSTLEWSMARLRHQHFIKFDLLYKKEKLRCASVNVPVILPQCLLSVDSVTLPTYSDAGYPVPSKRLWDQPLPQYYNNCSCGKDSLTLKADAEGVQNLDKFTPKKQGIWLTDLRHKEESISSRDSYEEIRAAKRVNEYVVE